MASDCGVLVICLIAAIVTLAVLYLRRRLRYWQDRGIPYDEPSLLMGNMQGLRTKYHFKDIFDRLYKKYKGSGPFVGCFLFQKPAVLVLDGDLVKNILIKDFAKFTNRGIYHNEKDDPLTGHLFALDGLKWKQMRTKLSPTFTSGKMKFMFPTVVEVGRQFASVFGEIVAKREIVEIKDLLARFTTDVIGCCAFGLECNSLKDPNAMFHVMGKRSFVERRHGEIVTALTESFPDLARRLGLRIIHEDIHQFFMRITRETVTYREANNVKRNDFMNLLIELKNNKTEEDGETLTGLSMEEVAAQLFVFFLAGFETSSSTMGFALYELALNQDVQEKLRQEVITVMANHRNQFTYECMKEMQYLDQVIAETLRKYPIVPQLIRKSLADYTVQTNTRYVIPKDVQALIPVWSIHHDPEIYPDPNTFNPDRFTPEEMMKHHHSLTWLPFGDGPRNCIGMRFGKMQTRIGLALLVKSFHFSVSDRTVLPMDYNLKSFTLSSKDGIFLKVETISTDL